MQDGSPRPGGARYDGWAEWYDQYIRGRRLYSDLPAHIGRLVGRGDGICIDVGCGTGVYLNTIASLGGSVIGVDLSVDQLRLAVRRWSSVVQADAAQLPFPPNHAARVVSVLTHTDIDDLESFLREAGRVIVPGGQLVLLATHPCFVGPFARMEGGPDGNTIIHPGYWNRERVFEGPGIGDGIRARVGARHVPMADLLNGILASGLQIDAVEELGDGAVPWLLALVASKPKLASATSTRYP
ncbi:MAG: class I SAM-dependent methyltransferase [Gemmatimonadales bacterium]